MKLLRLITSLVFTLSALAGYSQHEEKRVVVYDPLFWNKQLNLKPGQYRKISEINIEFYQYLSSVSHENSNDPIALKLKVAESLEHRSEQIWNTFYPNQRRKWQKIMNENHDLKI